MSRFLSFALILGAWIAWVVPAFAKTHDWQIVSPDHGQTWALGTESNRVWKSWGGHLVLLLTFTNDPFVDRQNPREWDNFRFDFPNVRIGADGRTFYYSTAEGWKAPVAARRSDFLGLEEVRLLPNADVSINSRSGFLTVSLNVLDLGDLSAN